MTFTFAWPWLFLCLPLPWLVWRYARPVRRRGAGAIRVPFFALLANGEQRRDGGTAPRRAMLVSLCWVLLVTAAARPQWIGEPDRVLVSGRNLMLAVDISGSMKTADLTLRGEPADRLSVVKALGGDFLARRVGDRVGLVLFGSQAYLQAPLTLDRRTVATLLNESVIGMAGERTAIGDAIGLAVKRLREIDGDQRVLILMTDGANTAGAVDPSRAARLAAMAGLTIYTIGIGADRMSVSTLFGVREVNPSADLEEALLEEIASATGGRYFRARGEDDLEDVYRLIDELEPVPGADLDARRVAELFHWPLALVVLVVLGWMIANLGTGRWPSRSLRDAVDAPGQVAEPASREAS